MPEDDASPLRDGIHPTALPPELEQRVVARLRREGLIAERRDAPRSRIAIAWAASLALAVALGALGALGATRRSHGLSAGDATHLLLVVDDAPAPADRLPDRVREYAAWAREQARAGRLVAGERLLDGGWRVSPEGPRDGAAAPGPDDVSGFFLLRAEDDEQALSVARSCPHLAHGGSLRLRPIAR